MPPRLTENWSETRDRRSPTPARRPSTALRDSLNGCRAVSDFLMSHSLYSSCIILRPDMQSLSVTNGYPRSPRRQATETLAGDTRSREHVWPAGPSHPQAAP